MARMLHHVVLLGLLSLTGASLPGLRLRQASFSGIATFNNFGTEGPTVCGSTTGKSHYLRQAGGKFLRANK